MSTENLKLEIDHVETLPSVKKLYDVRNVQPPSMPWVELNSTVHCPRNMNEKGLFTTLNEPYNESLWKLVQYSLPPFLDKKYHTLNIKELSKNPNNNILCSTRFVMWNEAMGMPLLNLIKIKIFKYKWAKNHSKESLDEWKLEVDGIINSLELIWTESDFQTPINIDLCSNPADFLLEPCVLVQLPFKPVLLHQWLTAALAEILMFERDSVDFRHWPLCKMLREMTYTLLATVRRRKSLLMHVFSVLNKVLISNLEISLKWSKLLLDIIVECIPLLEFLITKKYKQFFKVLRKNSWLNEPKFGNVNKLSYVPRHCFQDSSIENTTFPFDITTLNLEFMEVPIVKKQGMVTKQKKSSQTKQETSSQSKQKTSSETKPKFDDNKTSKKLSFDEKYILNILENNQNLENVKLSCKDRCELTVRVIQEKVIDTGKLSGISTVDIEKTFQSSKAQIHAANIFCEKSTENVLHAIRQAMMYNEISKQLIDSEKENSAAAQIIKLQLEVLAREQISRLTNTCRLIFNLNIVAKKYDFDAVRKLLTTIEEILNSFGNNSMSTILSKFPEEWKKPVDIKEKIPDLDSNLNERIVLFENRIGRLIYNIAQECYNKSEEENKVIFPSWNVVQYILPCLVAKYVNENETDNLEALQNIHEIITTYEISYNKWQTKCEAKVIKNIYEGLEISTREIKDFWQLINSNLQLYASKILGPQNIITSVLQNIHSWYLMGPQSPCFIFIIIFIKYHEFVYTFTKDIIEMSSQNHSLLKVGDSIPLYPELGELYFASAVLSDIEILHTLEQSINCNTEIMPLAMASNFCDILEKLISLNDETDKNELMTFIEEKKNELCIYYEKVKHTNQANYETIFYDAAITLLPHSTSLRASNAVLCYLKSNFTALENILTILFPKKLDCEKKCRNCSKVENGTRKLLMCTKCVRDKNYPDVNYFCGLICQKKWCQKEHMAEHLEFELGLYNFSCDHKAD